VVAPIHAKGMPVILAIEEDCETWLTGSVEDALALQQPATDDLLQIVATGAKSDPSQRIEPVPAGDQHAGGGQDDTERHGGVGCRVNTCAVARARSISSPLRRCSRSLRSGAFRTSLAVRACRKLGPPAASGSALPASPLSRSVSRTLASAAAGTGRRPAFAAGRCYAASV
jgi:hypothetical protein